MNNYWLKAIGKSTIIDIMLSGSSGLNPDYYVLLRGADVHMFLSAESTVIAVARKRSIM